jgi:hypothetical protein
LGLGLFTGPVSERCTGHARQPPEHTQFGIFRVTLIDIDCTPKTAIDVNCTTCTDGSGRLVCSSARSKISYKTVHGDAKTKVESPTASSNTLFFACIFETRGLGPCEKCRANKRTMIEVLLLISCHFPPFFCTAREAQFLRPQTDSSNHQHIRCIVYCAQYASLHYGRMDQQPKRYCGAVVPSGRKRAASSPDQYRLLPLLISMLFSYLCVVNRKFSPGGLK